MWFFFVSLLLPHEQSKESLGQEKELSNKQQRRRNRILVKCAYTKDDFFFFFVKSQTLALFQNYEV